MQHDPVVMFSRTSFNLFILKLQTHNVRSHIKTYILLLLGVLIGITVTLLSQGDLRDYMTTAAGMSIETKHEVVKVVDKNVAKMLDNQRWIDMDRDSVLTVLNSHNTSLPVEIPTVARDKARELTQISF